MAKTRTATIIEYERVSKTIKENDGKLTKEEIWKEIKRTHNVSGAKDLNRSRSLKGGKNGR